MKALCAREDRMTPRTALTLLLLTVGCGELGLTTFNATPEATITWPAPDAVVHPGVTTLLGRVTDLDDAVDELRVAWSVDGQPACEPAPPDADGRVACDVDLRHAEDPQTITLMVCDPELAWVRDRLNVDVQNP